MRSAPGVLAFLMLACSSGGGSTGAGGADGGGTGGAAGAGGGGAGGTAGSAGTGGTGNVSGNFGPAEVLAADQTASFRVAVKNGTVYWNSRGASFQPQPGSLQSIPAAGGTAQEIASGDIRALTTTANEVLWANATTGNLHSAPLSGSPVTTVTAADEVADILVVAGYLYWTSLISPGSRFRRYPLAGGATEDLVPPGQNQYIFLAGDDADLYVVASLSGALVLLDVPLSTGTGTVFADLTELVPPAVDGAYVYVASTGGVLRYPRTGGGSGETVATLPGAFAIALDADAAYVTVHDNTCQNTDGAVYRIPFATGTPVQLASNQACPSGIAVDESGVYWVNPGVRPASGQPFTPGSGALMRAKRQ